MKPTIALICGGKSAEHEISCLSALGIFEAIDRSQFDVALFGITRSGESFVPLRGSDDFDRDSNSIPIVPEGVERRELPSGIDLLFPVLHGANGEDGVFQGFAEFLGINYLGSGVLASALAMDKVRAKELFTSAGLEVAKGRAFENFTEAENLDLTYPLFIKPSRGGSSRGTTKVKSESGVKPAIEEALKYDRVALVEEAVVGREIECAILEVDGEVMASVAGEIRVLGGREFYDYEAKYLDSATEYLVPAPVDPEIQERIRTQAKTAFKALGCQGLARVDFFLREDGSLVINELNTMPGFTPKSVFPMLWQASGQSYREIISLMIQEALQNPKQSLRR